MKFPSVDMFWQLYELEISYRNLSIGAVNNSKWFADKNLRNLDMARSRAFWGAANIVAELIEKNDRNINATTKKKL